MTAWKWGFVLKYSKILLLSIIYKWFSLKRVHLKYFYNNNLSIDFSLEIYYCHQITVFVRNNFNFNINCQNINLDYDTCIYTVMKEYFPTTVETVAVLNDLIAM